MHVLVLDCTILMRHRLHLLPGTDDAQSSGQLSWLISQKASPDGGGDDGGGDAGL